MTAPPAQGTVRDRTHIQSGLAGSYAPSASGARTHDEAVLAILDRERCAERGQFSLHRYMKCRRRSLRLVLYRPARPAGLRRMPPSFTGDLLSRASLDTMAMQAGANIRSSHSQKTKKPGRGGSGYEILSAPGGREMTFSRIQAPLRQETSPL